GHFCTVLNIDITSGLLLLCNTGMQIKVTSTVSLGGCVNSTSSFSAGAADGGGPELKSVYEFILKPQINLRRFDEIIKRTKLKAPNERFRFQLWQSLYDHGSLSIRCEVDPGVFDGGV
ncbi:unnamed protein product, partial [Owenia fusiformis]